MNRDRLLKLLEVYDLEEILANLDLEDIDLLELLAEQGLLESLSLPEPL